MALPVVNFQPETFQQANPFLAGVGASQDIMQNAQNIYKNNVLNQFLGPQQQQALQQAIYQNQILAPQAQLAPKMAQANLQQAQAQPGLTYAQANQANAAAEQAGQQALTLKAQRPWIPLQNITAAISASARMGNFYNSRGALLKDIAGQPAGQNLIAGNPALAQAYANTAQYAAGNTGPQTPSLSGGVPGIPNLSNFLPSGYGGQQLPPQQGQQQGQQGAAPQQNNYGSGALQQPMITQPGQQIHPNTQQAIKMASSVQNALPAQQPANPFDTQNNWWNKYSYAANPNDPMSQDRQDVENVKQGLLDSSIKNTQNPALIQQRTYDNSTENQLKNISPMMPQIAMYAGLAGKANESIDKYVASTFGTNSPQYQNLTNFQNVQAPLLGGELSRALGYRSSKTQLAKMNNIINQITLSSNPQLALGGFNTLVNTFKANEEALGQGPSQALASLQQGNANAPYAPSNALVADKTGKISQVPSANLRDYVGKGYTPIQPDPASAYVQTPDGRIGKIPANNLSAILQKYPELKRVQ